MHSWLSLLHNVPKNTHFAAKKDSLMFQQLSLRNAMTHDFLIDENGKL